MCGAGKESMVRVERDEEKQLGERASARVLVSISSSNYTAIYKLAIDVNYIHRATLARSHLDASRRFIWEGVI